MKKYEAYKPSCVEWIGEIPQEWEVTKLGWTYPNMGSGTTPDSNNQVYYSEDGYNWLQTGDLTDGEITSTSKHISQLAVDEKKMRFYPQNSVVIAMYGATIGKVGYLKIQTSTNQACCVLPPQDDIASKYIFYLMQSSKTALISKSIGGGQPNISQAIIQEHRIPLPPLSEQEVIAGYLDAKVGEIDSAVGAINAQIVDFKAYRQSIISQAVTKGLDPNAPLKPSNIQWIGNIPNHWEVCKVKHICNVTDGTHFSPKTTEIGKPYVTVSNVNNNIIDIKGAALISDEDFATLVKQGCQPQKGDVLLAKDGTVGRSAIVKDNNNFVCLSSLGILSPNHKIKSEYLKYSLDSIILQDQMTKAMAGSALRRITISKIQDFYTYLPPLAEQEAIAEYLDGKTAKIDASIKALEAQVADLQALKQATISEAVTGKIDLRDWTPSNAD